MMVARNSKHSAYLDADIPVTEAAVLLGVSSRTFHRIIDAGLIPYRIPMKKKRVRRGDVLAYKEQTTFGKPPEVAYAGREDALKD